MGITDPMEPMSRRITGVSQMARQRTTILTRGTRIHSVGQSARTDIPTMKPLHTMKGRIQMGILAMMGTMTGTMTAITNCRFEFSVSEIYLARSMVRGDCLP